MNRSRVTPRLLAASLLALGIAAAHAQQASQVQSDPSVNDIISGLEGDHSAAAPATRALRPGAAAAATAAPPAPAKTASISVQINFGFNSDAVSTASQATVDNLAAAMKSPQLASRSFAIIGHTDGKGTAAYNQSLSERRAAAIKRELIRQGVPAERLQSTGKGMSELLNPQDPYASENRRVEIQASG